jgi:flavine halogenase
MASKGRRAMAERTDVLVAGGGPAGAMTAALLAREGFKVILCEKDGFPRYHIGESLLTSAIPLLEFVGAAERVERHGFVKKRGAYFRVKRDQPAGHIDFGKLSRYRYSYQVLRSEFDAILLDHARECGASVHERTAVASVQFENHRPVAAVTRSVDGSTGSIAFDYFVDATGQSGLLSAKYFKNRHEELAFANVAVGGYFRGARPYRDFQGVERPGAFSMEALTDGSGWTWAIPLHDGTLSVGVVVHRDVYKTRRRAWQSPEHYFAKTLELSPDVTSLISGTPREGEIQTWRDYSYFAAAFAGPGYRLAGDAAGFIDPLFSTGVHLAFLGALSSAATICSVLRGELAEEAAQRFHERFLRQSYTRFMLTVAGFYRQIRDQKTLVLPSISRENFQLAFDLIQPVVSGNADVQPDEIDPDLLARALEYTTAVMLEAHGIDSNNRLAGLVSTRMMDESANRLEPVDEMFIRLKLGQLGVERLGKIGAALVGARKSIIRGAVALAGRGASRLGPRDDAAHVQAEAEVIPRQSEG